MIQVSSHIDVQAPADVVFAVLWDVARYPEFLTDVMETSVIPGDSPWTQEVDYDVKLVRLRRYRLRMQGEPGRSVRWSLMHSESLVHNEGAWRIAPLADGRGCRLDYDINLELSVAVPEVIVRRMVEYNMPTMLRQVKARVESKHRRGPT